MKLLLLSLAVLAPCLAQASPAQILNHNLNSTELTQGKYDKFHSKVKFSYGLQYLGPSLSSKYQDGATYNRINGGQDYKNDDTDATSSTQLYQGFSLGYQATKNIAINYSVTFQNDLNKNIEYNVYNADGSVFAVNKRDAGISQNNHRINSMVTNIYSNRYFFLMSNFHYELPTTQTAKDTDMLYGLGIQPTLGFFSNVAGLSHGLKASLERDYYKKQEYSYACGPVTCTTKRQTLRANIGAYIGYNFSDQLSFKADIEFDWDQDGDQVGTNNYNKNMDDIVKIGPNYRVNKNMSIGGAIQYAISDSSPEKSALLGTFSLSL